MISKDDSMIDGLFQSISPEDFFRHRDFRPMVIEAVRGNEKPFLALLAAPGVWDVSKHQILPLYAAYKTNSRDNAEFPPSHWQLVFSAHDSEEMVILPWDENGKTPPSDASEPTPPPPGHKPKVTFSFDQDWRDVMYEKLAPGPKTWKAVLHAGSFLSNRLTLEIKNGARESNGPISQRLDNKSISDYPGSLRRKFSRTPLHPQAPDHGVAFAKQLERGAADNPGLLLNGAFAFPSFISENENLSLHLFLTADGIPNGIRISLQVPKVFLQDNGKTLHGSFSVDIMPYFVNSAGTLLAPKVIYVTPIRGEYIGEPHRMAPLETN